LSSWAFETIVESPVSKCIKFAIIIRFYDFILAARFEILKLLAREIDVNGAWQS